MARSGWVGVDGADLAKAWIDLAGMQRPDIGERPITPPNGVHRLGTDVGRDQQEKLESVLAIALLLEGAGRA
jgi:hypothetical protein